jgi:hypothetical protein
MSSKLKPTYHSPIFNSFVFQTSGSTASFSRQSVQKFPRGIKTPFIEFTGDNSMQMNAAEKTSMVYLDQNIQLNVQPFRNNIYLVKTGCNSVYIPMEKPSDGYTIEIFNIQSSPVVLVSENFKIFNNLYLPTGDNSINIFPKHRAILKFFENCWSLLIF